MRRNDYDFKIVALKRKRKNLRLWLLFLVFVITLLARCENGSPVRINYADEYNSLHLKQLSACESAHMRMPNTAGSQRAIYSLRKGGSVDISLLKGLWISFDADETKCYATLAEGLIFWDNGRLAPPIFQIARQRYPAFQTVIQGFGSRRSVGYEFAMGQHPIV
ncbi:hypothetical protein [Pseudomonas sp. dw_358]|uniref:hypothetical protein n=1 Tax=Pseudomonas sp. dw_358 TaxID=2720083 RepID=UPI001BD29E37|nr:hypothetical protein [Pseudomonas sp. dw_358]